MKDYSEVKNISFGHVLTSMIWEQNLLNGSARTKDLLSFGYGKPGQRLAPGVRLSFQEYELYCPSAAENTRHQIIMLDCKMNPTFQKSCTTQEFIIYVLSMTTSRTMTIVFYGVCHFHGGILPFNRRKNEITRLYL